VPSENPITEEKRVLGKILFWEEQLSSDDTVACGTCHDPTNGGNDNRLAYHPGLNGHFGDFDDKLGSPGVVLTDERTDYVESAEFGFRTQVTGRAANSFFMAAYFPEVFWDGRAGRTFVDPDTGEVLIQHFGALENQVLGPPLSEVEMGHPGRDWAQVTARLAAVEPLALATDLPPDMAAAIAARPSYPELFEAAFGSAKITAARIAFAIATYERTLIPDQTPWDQFKRGDHSAMTPNQLAGWETFRSFRTNCLNCHLPPEFSDLSFRNIGIRPIEEDPGRAGVTGNHADRGLFKVPSLRNVGLKRTFMHNGGVVRGPMNSLADVVDYYAQDGGHELFTDNIDVLVTAGRIPAAERPNLVDFMANALTDPRVAAGTFPFDRPRLRSDLGGNIQLTGAGRAGSGGLVPQMIAQTPPHLGSAVFRIGVSAALGGRQAWVVFSLPQSAGARLITAASLVLAGKGEGEGFGTWHWRVPASTALAGVVVDLTWLVSDPGAQNGLAISPTARFTLF
jgi:cytochrome c peroxidase